MWNHVVFVIFTDNRKVCITSICRAIFWQNGDCTFSRHTTKLLRVMHSVQWDGISYVQNPHLHTQRTLQYYRPVSVCMFRRPVFASMQTTIYLRPNKIRHSYSNCIYDIIVFSANIFIQHFLSIHCCGNDYATSYNVFSYYKCIKFPWGFNKFMFIL
jgi:hypothetical protein